MHWTQAPSLGGRAELGLGGGWGIVLECHTRQHVLRRIRTSVLEAGTVDLLRAVGLEEPMDR